MNIGTVVTPAELSSMYPDGEFYRLSNEDEHHYGMKYKTGVNTDILPFNPTWECSDGGMYFFHVSQLHMYQKYCSNVKYIRKVTFTGKSKIYVEKNKFKTNKFVLGDREVFNTDLHIGKYLNEKGFAYERCKNAVEDSGYSLEYISAENQTEEICKIAIKTNPLSIEFVKNQTPELCKYALSISADAMEFIKPENRTEDICLYAVTRHSRNLKYVKNQTLEMCKIAVENNYNNIKYVNENLKSEFSRKKRERIMQRFEKFERDPETCW